MTENYDNNVTVDEAVEKLNGLAEEMTQGATTTPEQPISVYEMPPTPTVSPFAETTTDDKPVSTAKLIIGGVGIAAAGYGAVKGVKWVINKIKTAKAEKEEFRKWKESQRTVVVESDEVPETEKLYEDEFTE